jgi:tRNA pseudouridine32 synthase/23S rRNA pseudouridine746 synthase
MALNHDPSLSAYLHELTADVRDIQTLETEQPDYWYQGYCPQSQTHYQLPRTGLAKAVARQLMHHLSADPELNYEGKMYGVLLVRTATGQTAYLKAFSGLLEGQATRPGWVPPIPGRERVALQEATTLQALEAMKQRLMELQDLPERHRYQALLASFNRQRQVLNQHHRQRKNGRDQERQRLCQTLRGDELEAALAALAQQSRADKAELRTFKQTKAEQLAPIEASIQAADAEIHRLKQQRKSLSRQLQADMHQAYSLTNFAGQSLTIQVLAGDRTLPTGTGDCCAPKLLHFAAEHGLTPLAMAEFWWGPDTADKRQGQFYEACAERCQPIIGFLLSGLSATSAETQGRRELSLEILYADDSLVVVDKPASLLSVPGRYYHRQDSVLSRLRLVLPDGEALVAVHRLDQDTSGVLLLARHKQAERCLRQQFQNQQVQKIYEALVMGQPPSTEGLITLPLVSNPQERPRQTVDWQRGKPCQTRYRVLGKVGDLTRVEFYPLTGRTHQLRVHAAHPMGLNAAIVGDRLYGECLDNQRLCLHARQLHLRHPDHGGELAFEASTPF